MLFKLKVLCTSYIFECVGFKYLVVWLDYNLVIPLMFDDRMFPVFSYYKYSYDRNTGVNLFLSDCLRTHS